MKKLVKIMAAMMLLPITGAFARGEGNKTFENTPKLKFYGFVRNYMAFDTRVSKAGTLDLFYYMPLDRKLDNNVDVNATPSMRFAALTSRVGLDFTGLQYGSTKIGGKIEADFYSLNGTTGIGRLRQAYAFFLWDKLGGSKDSKLKLSVGQMWHPMAIEMPYVVDLEIGTPFTPFSRTPQITTQYSINKNFGITGSLIYGMQYLPTGPKGKSLDYMEYGMLPELYFDFNFKTAKTLTKVGFDLLSIVPSKNVENYITKRMTGISPFVYFQYSDGLFSFNAKSVYAQAGDHINLMSGYGVSREVAVDGGLAKDVEYTPQQTINNYVSVRYGGKWQVMGMLGYLKLLGTTKELASAESYWFNSNGDKNMLSAVRFTPTLCYSIGKLSIALEYDLTTVQFGESALSKHGLANMGATHWVTNHRILSMLKLSF